MRVDPTMRHEDAVARQRDGVVYEFRGGRLYERVNKPAASRRVRRARK